jgi:Asp-tRNA(Asn)/Glu-tRNA(Gln) amidotransferase A subunit family amidase
MELQQPVATGRRRVVALLAGLGVAETAALAAPFQAVAESSGTITREAVIGAERLAGVEFTDAERELMMEGLRDLQQDYARLRELALDNSIPPATGFAPLVPPPPLRPGRPPLRPSHVAPIDVPADLEELAFLPVTQLSELVRTRQVSSLALTEMYLARLERHDPTLHCVITLTRERALAQARRADRELAAGRWLGPLHGIPWGAKDLLATRGYPTTWGAVPYRDQEIDEDATVVRRLDDAGAVLVAKLSLGALAWGDVWFREKTRNPWNPEQGSSGSSAGPASATAAGLVGFAIGSETWGSIVSPSTRCGTTGLRPTFGRVSRHGAMALSWSMDKLGPICRSAEDCALVCDAIRGADPRDPSTVDAPFDWTPEVEPRRLRVGYLRSSFENEPELPEDADADARTAAAEWQRIDRQALEVLRSLGVELVPFELPDLPVAAMSFILSAEAAAAFDDLTRSGRDDLMVRQVEQAWPNVFRQSRLIPAVEYIQANRARTLLMREMERVLEGLDVYVTRTFAGDELLATNLTGHPSVVVPDGFRSDGTPTSLVFGGRLWGEAQALALAGAYQRATDWHTRHPPSFSPRPEGASRTSSARRYRGSSLVGP